MSRIVRVSRKYAIYLPKSIVKELGIRGSDRFNIEVRDRELIPKPLPKLFRKRRYWGKISFEEVERDSEELMKIIESENC